MFKVFTRQTQYGHKLTGLRCYDCHDKVVLSVGWFQDAEVMKVDLKPNERVVGLEGSILNEKVTERGIIPSQGATLYDVKFRIYRFD